MKKRLIAVPMLGIEQSVQSVHPTLGTSALMQKRNNWWQQSTGVLHVRNGFAVQGLIALPVPRLKASEDFVQRLLSRNNQQ